MSNDKALEIIENDVCGKIYQYTGKKKNGKRIEFEYLPKRVEYQGKTAGVVAIQDITKQKKAEKSFRKINDELKKSKKIGR